jgi:hypothetical protein
MLLFPTNKEVDKETEKLQTAVISLFSSGQKHNQILALQQCKLVGLQKNKLIWDYVKKDWNKNNIIENWGLAYAEGLLSSDYVVFEVDFFDGKIQLIDSNEAVYLSIPDHKSRQVIANWNERAIDEMYTEVYKRFKNSMLNLLQIIEI